MTEDLHAPDQVPTFSDVLNLLLNAQAKPHPTKPGEYIAPSNTEIADAINAKYGPRTITSEHVRKLRTGQVKSPSIEMASFFAGFFQLPLDVFNARSSETSQKVVEEVQRFLDARRHKLSEETNSAAVAVLARTARRLSPAGQARVAQFARQVEKLEAMEEEPGPRAAPPTA
ncbi:hypothetical protein [Streptomyces longispororuber]|uniref:hypothetical protein n=1 Tax=Streptomyces longispororuber TaxID=68230 RepID=UPI0036FE6BFA